MSYEDPAQPGEPDKAAKQAKNGLSFFALQDVLISVGPKLVDTGGHNGGTNAAADAHDEVAHVGQGRGGAGAAGQGNAGAAKGGANAKDKGAGGGTDSGAPEKPADTGTPAGAKGGGGTGTGQPTGPASQVMIGDQQIQATLIVVPEPDSHGLMMGGDLGFWQSTTVTAARYADSDRIQSVTVKAENLVPKRLGQFATIVGDLAGLGGVKLDEAAEKPPPLPNFIIDVASTPVGAPQAIKGTAAWTYTLNYSRPQGSVTWAEFKARAMGKGKVNYFPVPACLNAKLSLETTARDEKGRPKFSYDFPQFVVSNPDFVRLEPLPVDGKLSLSPVCSSSVEGTAASDPYDEAVADFEAAYKGYSDLTKKDSSKGGGAQAGTGDSAAGKDAKKTSTPSK